MSCATTGVRRGENNIINAQLLKWEYYLDCVHSASRVYRPCDQLLHRSFSYQLQLYAVGEYVPDLPSILIIFSKPIDNYRVRNGWHLYGSIWVIQKVWHCISHHLYSLFQNCDSRRGLDDLLTRGAKREIASRREVGKNDIFYGIFGRESKQRLWKIFGFLSQKNAKIEKKTSIFQNW